MHYFRKYNFKKLDYFSEFLPLKKVIFYPLIFRFWKEIRLFLSLKSFLFINYLLKKEKTE